MAARVETIVMRSIQEAISERNNQGVPRILLLLQIPSEELDRLEVPIDTPNFYELSPRLRRALLVSLRRQEEAHRRGETRRTANFMMNHNLLSQGEGPLRPEELPRRLRRVAELRDQVIGGSNEERRGNEEDLNDEDMDLVQVLRDRPVIRVDTDPDVPTDKNLRICSTIFLCISTCLRHIQVEICCTCQVPCIWMT